MNTPHIVKRGDLVCNCYVRHMRLYKYHNSSPNIREFTDTVTKIITATILMFIAGLILCSIWIAI